MGHGESQIGYLANYINLYGEHARRPALTQPSSNGSLYGVLCLRDKLVAGRGNYRESAVMPIVQLTLIESFAMSRG